MAKYGIIIKDTEDGKLLIEAGGMTDDSGDPRLIPPDEYTLAMKAFMSLTVYLAERKAEEEG